ncbi:MAG: phosphatidate cytidylyltransferase [Lentisphaerae bacterium]|jgi:phosphatidate cytidylyltransferase|nr:phosphatidate cytidylyltransferase [Lentisphaerota bacterium]MBT4817432.1 phosphatidate cytidylyltransferase [Lentisphaerota bacterium]MBT5611242.1 phosphatidate cytidylyltransferase [Lentisphaerota bacterium]MBT7057856.1 phosphatidate cytidylyltransferase [Lentisphaerota bacterium]MBT7841104.1 phosphatidate cytidylyltransferase [Lentisphaerota bacterium]
MLRERITTSIPLVLLALVAFLWPGWPGAVVFAVLCCAFLVVGARELFAMTDALGFPGRPGLVGGLGCALVVIAMPWGGPAVRLSLVNPFSALAALVIVLLLIALFFDVFRRGPSREAILNALVSVGGFVYLCWTLSFVAKLYFIEGTGSTGRVLTAFLIVGTKLADVGAFAVGTAGAKRPGGNHQLVPSLSPKKSWEGLAGGTVASVLCTLTFLAVAGRHLQVAQVNVIGFWSAVVLGVLFSVVGLIGDLAESALKRASGTKDSGRLPGLGGALDVLDSLIFVAPIFYCYVQLMAMLQ